MTKIKTALILLFQSFKLLLLFSMAFSLSHCAGEEEATIPDVSDISVDLDLKRFEQDLFQLDTGKAFASELAELEQEYGEFAKVFFNFVLGSRNQDITSLPHEEFVRGFITYPSIRQLYDTTQVLFGNLQNFREELEQAFRFYQYYFPQRNIPTVTTYLSEFGYQAFIYGNDDLAVGLDFFLGANYPYRQIDRLNPNFSAYLTRTYNRDHLTLKTMLPLAQELVGDPEGSRMLDVMIQKGKQLYLLDRLLPYHPDTVIMEVSAEQWSWLQDNELEIWAYFLTETDPVSGQNLLYSTDWATFRKYVEYGPTSPGMPEESPGRTGCFLGWQIVDAWMKEQGHTGDLEALLQEKDAQKILEEARYKPARR